jgi:hypothetical protein
MERRSKHLSSEECGGLFAEHYRGNSQQGIGRLLGRSASTICRELARGYFAQHDQEVSTRGDRTIDHFQPENSNPHQAVQMDAYFVVSLQIPHLPCKCARRMQASGQKWQKGIGVALMPGQAGGTNGAVTLHCTKLLGQCLIAREPDARSPSFRPVSPS